MKIFWLILVVILSVSCEKDPRADFLISNPDFDEQFRTKISAIYEDYNLHGDFIIGIVNEKGLFYSTAINRHILGGKPSNLDENSPIYIASQTKSFTGTLLKILAEDGIIDLDESIYTYLPELNLKGHIDTKTISVRQLLNHTHGIHSTMLTWKTAFLGYDGGNEELIEAINSNFGFDPTHMFRYSNTGPIIAAMIVEKATGNTWKTEMNDRIFRPLDMDQTSTNVSDYNLSEIRPSILVGKNNEVFMSGFYKTDRTMHASGGIISSINDLSKWLKFNINRDLSLFDGPDPFTDLHKVHVKQRRSYFKYDRFGYTLGWDMAKYQGDTLLTRFGSYGGISFHLSFIPARKIGIVAFSNDNRATYLVHLAANYAYNLINNNPRKNNIFKKEVKVFARQYDRIRNLPMPKTEMKLIKSEDNDNMIGRYINDLGWPAIVINNKDSAYFMNWGDLSGPVFKNQDFSTSYITAFGPLMRRFRMNSTGDSLFTGSLKYRKTN